MQDFFAEDIIVDGEIVIRWPYLWDVNSGSGIGLRSAGKNLSPEPTKLKQTLDSISCHRAIMS